MSKVVRAVDVVNSVFGPGIFKIPGGRATYDEVWMMDGGNAMYLCRLSNDLSITKRWIPWHQYLIMTDDGEEALRK